MSLYFVRHCDNGSYAFLMALNLVDAVNLFQDRTGLLASEAHLVEDDPYKIWLAPAEPTDEEEE